MKFTTIALLIATVSAIQLHGKPHDNRDYWDRENEARENEAKAIADAAAAKAAAA